MRKSDEPLADTLVRCLADPTDLKALERLENDGDQAGARLMRARLADQAALRLDAALEDNLFCFNVCSTGSAVFFRSVG